MKIHSITCNPMNMPRAPGEGAVQSKFYRCDAYDMRLVGVRAPVLGGDNKESTVIQMVFVRSTAPKDVDMAPTLIPLSNVADIRLMTEKEEAAAGGKK